MSKFFGVLLVMSSLLGCDAVVGTEPCAGTRCEDPPPSLAVPLSVKFVRVPTETTLDLPIVSTTDSLCNLPCTEPVRLFPAEGDAAWTLSRTAGLPTLKLLQGSGPAIDLTLTDKAPEGGAIVSSLFVSGVSDGGAVAHIQWRLPKGDSYDELSLVQHSGHRSHLPLAPKPRLPRGAIVAPQGFLLFDAVAQRQEALAEPAIPTGAVRLVDASGGTLWQQGRFPSYASVVGSSAVALAEGFVVGAADGTEPGSKYGLLSLDATGKLTRFGFSSDSSWYSARLLPLGPTAYAVAAESEIEGVIDGTGSGNLDVVIDRGDPKTLTGFRLERFCLYELALNGFSADHAGNLYVSTVTGEKGAPRGLLCELPVEGPPRCFQGRPNQLFGEIVATGSGSLFVVAGDQILSVKLPD